MVIVETTVEINLSQMVCLSRTASVSHFWHRNPTYFDYSIVLLHVYREIQVQAIFIIVVVKSSQTNRDQTLLNPKLRTFPSEPLG